jgi:hypothetical protein
MRPALASAPANPQSGTAAPTGNNGVSGRSDLGNGFACTIHSTEGVATMATSAERMRAHRERERRGLRRFTISVSADDLSVIAEHGYEGAARTDQDCRSEAVSLFIGDTVACLDRTG